MKKTKALLLISLSSALVACGGGVDQPKPVGPSSSVAVSSSSAVVSSSSVAVSSSSAVVSSSSVADSSSSAVVSSSSEADSSSSVAVSSSSSSVAAANQAARIKDTVNGDTGELRVNTPDANTAPMLTGQLTVSFLKDADILDTAGANKDAYVTVWAGGGTSNSNAIVDVRIQSNAIVFRGQETTMTPIPYQTGAWQTISISWNTPNTATPPTVSVVVNGDTANTKTFTAISTATGGVTSIAFKLSDNTAVITSDKAFYVDDWHLYSDAAGTTEVLYDDFEGYSVTTNLSGAQIRQTGVTYHTNTQDASVVELAK